jgi:sterol desaturase/sphingolipid hydroxylase (fatty acid hydroxylase superfamily)
MDSVAYWYALVSAFLAVAVWESLRPWKELSTSTARRWGNHSLLFVACTICSSVVYRTGPVIVALAAAGSRWGILNRPSLPFAVRCILTVLVVDFVKYATHRAFHSFSSLWRIHQVHHSDPDFDVSTAFRVHPIELLLTQGSVLATIAVLAPPPLAVIAADVLSTIASLFEHANTVLPAWLERVLRGLLITPEVHRVHHSEEIAEQNSNFGEILPWWDRLLGTYVPRPAAGRDALVTGLKGFQTPDSLGVRFMLIQPFRESGADANGQTQSRPVQT